MNLENILDRLQDLANPESLAAQKRFGIDAPHALGIPMAEIQKLAKVVGKRHELCDPLWATEIYEARLLVAYIGEADKLTAEQMDRWVANFDNWGICDTLAFALFDKNPELAWPAVDRWAADERLYVRRASFATLWGLSGHDKSSPDEVFLARLPLIERYAADDRPHVKKAVDMAFRAVTRRSPEVREACRQLAKQLNQSHDKSAKWIGNSTLKHLAKSD